MNNRIKSLDGWRAVAALGVVWIHVWTLCGNPALGFAGINFYKLIAIVGNGVDFFFVISGFCLYLILYKKEITVSNYVHFIKKRWLRIAPAFYAAVFVVSLVYFFFDEQKDIFHKIIPNLLFYQNIKTNSTISPPFWSLAVEFQFYLFLPFFFLLSKKIEMGRTILIFFIAGLILNCYFNNDFYRYMIVTKVVHFTVGIFFAWIYKMKPAFHAATGKFGFFVLSIAMAFCGRYLMSDVFYNAHGKIILFAKTMGPALLVTGFGGMMINTIFNNTTGKYLSGRVMTFLGKISYSIYLWHAFLLEIVGSALKGFLHFGSFNPLLLFAAVLIILIPVSYLSYSIFEKFYFKKKE